MIMKNKVKSCRQPNIQGSCNFFSSLFLQLFVVVGVVPVAAFDAASSSTALLAMINSARAASALMLSYHVCCIFIIIIIAIVVVSIIASQHNKPKACGSHGSLGG